MTRTAWSSSRLDSASHQLDVIGLIGGAPLPRVVAALEVAPDLTLAGVLDDAVHGEQELVAAGGHDRVVQREVPRLELLRALGRAAALDAPPQLVEVALGGVGDHQRQHLGLDELAGGHDVGGPHLARVGAVAVSG